MALSFCEILVTHQFIFYIIYSSSFILKKKWVPEKGNVLLKIIIVSGRISTRSPHPFSFMWQPLQRVVSLASSTMYPFPQCTSSTDSDFGHPGEQWRVENIHPAKCLRNSLRWSIYSCLFIAHSTNSKKNPHSRCRGETFDWRVHVGPGTMQ